MTFFIMKTSAVVATTVEAKKIPSLFDPLKIRYPAMISEMIARVIVSKMTAMISDIVVSVGVSITVIAVLSALSVGHGFPWRARIIIVKAKKINNRTMLVILILFEAIYYQLYLKNYN